MAEIEECILSRALDSFGRKKGKKMFRSASERYYTDIESYCYSIVEGRGFQSIQKVNGGSSCGCRCCFLEQAFFFSPSLFLSQISPQTHTHLYTYRLSHHRTQQTSQFQPRLAKNNPEKKRQKTTQQCHRKSDLGVKIRKAKRKRKKKKPRNES